MTVPDGSSTKSPPIDSKNVRAAICEDNSAPMYALSTCDYLERVVPALATRLSAQLTPCSFDHMLRARRHRCLDHANDCQLWPILSDEPWSLVGRSRWGWHYLCKLSRLDTDTFFGHGCVFMELLSMSWRWYASREDELSPSWNSSSA